MSLDIPCVILQLFSFAFTNIQYDVVCRSLMFRRPSQRHIFFFRRLIWISKQFYFWFHFVNHFRIFDEFFFSSSFFSIFKVDSALLVCRLDVFSLAFCCDEIELSELEFNRAVSIVI